jgi:hypothetical protein
VLAIEIDDRLKSLRIGVQQIADAKYVTILILDICLGNIVLAASGNKGVYDIANAIEGAGSFGKSRRQGLNDQGFNDQGFNDSEFIDFKRCMARPRTRQKLVLGGFIGRTERLGCGGYSFQSNAAQRLVDEQIGEDFPLEHL